MANTTSFQRAANERGGHEMIVFGAEGDDEELLQNYSNNNATFGDNT